MVDEEVLKRVKNSMGNTGDYQDDTLKEYIEEVKDYLLGAGVPHTIVESNRAIGIIARGVMDLWDYGNGTASLSPYFKERVVQLRAGELDV